MEQVPFRFGIVDMLLNSFSHFPVIIYPASSNEQEILFLKHFSR